MRRPPSLRRALAAGLATLPALVACGRGEGGARNGAGSGAASRDSAATIGGPPPTTTMTSLGAPTITDSAPAGARIRVVVIHLGAFADSAHARRLADSLHALGAAAYLRPVSRAGQAPLWRVRLALAPRDRRDRDDLRVAALRTLGARDAVGADDSVPAALAAPVRLHWVNRGGTHGMASRVRWVLSPDAGRMLVVDDPSSVENEPVADGWLYAAEQGAPEAIVGERSWDVAPSPDWTRVAAGVGFFASARERDSLGTSQWDSLTRASGLPVAEARRTAFAASGMAIAEAIARTAVWRLDAVGPPARAPFGGGWQVGWTADGRLAIGGAPTRAQEDALSPTWRIVDPATFTVRDSTSRAPAMPVKWIEGPTLDIGVPLDVRANRVLAIAGGTVEGHGGWISVRRGGTVQGIGPGLLLAASRTGRLVAAIIPDPSPRAHESPNQVVVYRVGP